MRRSLFTLAAAVALAAALTATPAHADRAANSGPVAATAPSAGERTYDTLEAALLAADLDKIVSDARSAVDGGQAGPRDITAVLLDMALSEDVAAARAFAEQAPRMSRLAVALVDPFLQVADGKMEEGAATLQDAAARFPAPLSDYGLALLLEADGRLDDAALVYSGMIGGLNTTPVEGEPRTLEDFNRALQAGETTAILFRAGQVNHRLGRFDEALRLYGLAAEFTPHAPLLLAEIGRAERRRAPLQGALTWRSALGRWLFALSDFAARTEGLQRILASDGPLEGLASETASLYAQFGILLDPSAEDWALATANELRSVEALEGADRILSRVSRSGPFAADAALVRAQIALDRDADDAARGYAQAAVSAAEDRWAVLVAAANVLSDVNADREAQRALTRALSQTTTPEDRANVLAARAFAHRHAGRIDDAVTDIRSALAVDRTDEVRFIAVAIFMDHPSAWPEGIAEARSMLAEHPESILRLNSLGYSLIQREQHLDEGFRLLWRAYSQNDRNDALVDSLGWAYYLYGRFDEARVLIERAHELTGTDHNSEILDHLGDVYWRLDRREDAEKAWRDALAARPDARLRGRIETKIANGLTAPAPVTRDPPEVDLETERPGRQDA